ncbi:hypothetical protein JR316_0011237 [Psilocybe cubensis]|uniref:Uncharacterized protein n=2 Tax=Psilocybe cubensis TaxID=181762 RepID=A0A8H7XWS6_PSICU|nr:hypothetical protein JR316_0011237 [Psilocybe cubensis]KAH9475678.1 hypothetical protein JR316_0011237 [Psilocybe cubensis]
MPKHIPHQHYSENPYELVDKTIIHPDIEHHDHEGEVTHYLLPTVFSIAQGAQFVAKYPGQGVFYFSEGELKHEDHDNPGSHIAMKAGSVLHVEEGSVFRWHCSSPEGAKGFGVFYVPITVKSIDEFIVNE